VGRLLGDITKQLKSPSMSKCGVGRLKRSTVPFSRSVNTTKLIIDINMYCGSVNVIKIQSKFYIFKVFGKKMKDSKIYRY
jgi:hypothetical protein